MILKVKHVKMEGKELILYYAIRLAHAAALSPTYLLLNQGGAPAASESHPTPHTGILPIKNTSAASLYSYLHLYDSPRFLPTDYTVIPTHLRMKNHHRRHRAPPRLAPHTSHCGDPCRARGDRSLGGGGFRVRVRITLFPVNPSVLSQPM